MESSNSDNDDTDDDDTAKSLHDIPAEDADNINPNSEENMLNHDNMPSSNTVSGITRVLNDLSIISPNNSSCTLPVCSNELLASKEETRSLDPNDLQPTLCTRDECISDHDIYKLQCLKCERLVHYKCTRLPLYQLQHFLTRKYRKFVCRNCTDVQHYLLDICTGLGISSTENNTGQLDLNEPMNQNRDDNNRLEEENTILKREIENLRAGLNNKHDISNVSVSMKDNDSKCTQSYTEIASSSTQTTTKWTEMEDLLKQRNKSEEELALKEQELNRIQDERSRDKKENSRLKQEVTTLEEHQNILRSHIKANEEIITKQNKQVDTSSTKDIRKLTTDNKLLQEQVNQLRNQEVVLRTSLKERDNRAIEIQTSPDTLQCEGGTDAISEASFSARLNDTMNQLSSDIISKVTKIVDDKLHEIDKRIQRKLEVKVGMTNGVSSQTSSYVSTAKKQSPEVLNLETIMRETKNNELIQEKEREKRAANLIIYGINETSDEQKNLKEQDTNFINSFLDTIGITSRPKQIIRLGKMNEKKQRPIKLVMDNISDKESIMSRLSNLKNAEPIYRSVSVRDDYTIEERELVREWVKKAEDKNKEYNTQAWKVRGTPKNGLRLAKITKRT